MLFFTVMTFLALAPPLAEDASYQEGLRLYEDFEYERAVFRFEEALRDETRSSNDRATILIRLGMTRAELRDDERAVNAFIQALSLDPLLVLPADASPTIKDLLDTARARLRDQKAGTATPAPTTTPAPTPTTGPTPAPTPAPDELATTDTPSSTSESEGLPVLPIVGLGIAGVGVVAALVGGLALGGGIGLAMYASGLEFQDEAQALALPAYVAQVGGYVGLAVGVVVLVVGGGIAGASFLME